MTSYFYLAKQVKRGLFSLLKCSVSVNLDLFRQAKKALTQRLFITPVRFACLNTKIALPDGGAPF